MSEAGLAPKIFSYQLSLFSLVNGKKQEKFRQRAVALRRVSIVLLVFGLVKCKFKDFKTHFKRFSNI